MCTQWFDVCLAWGGDPRYIGKLFKAAEVESILGPAAAPMSGTAVNLNPMFMFMCERVYLHLYEHTRVHTHITSTASTTTCMQAGRRELREWRCPIS